MLNMNDSILNLSYIRLGDSEAALLGEELSKMKNLTSLKLNLK